MIVNIFVCLSDDLMKKKLVSLREFFEVVLLKTEKGGFLFDTILFFRLDVHDGSNSGFFCH